MKTVSRVKGSTRKIILVRARVKDWAQPGLEKVLVRIRLMLGHLKPTCSNGKALLIESCVFLIKIC